MHTVKTASAALAMLAFMLCVSAQTSDPKQLSLYGCAPLVSGSLTPDWIKVCKLFEPETKRRFIIGIVDDGKGGGIAIVPLDK